MILNISQDYDDPPLRAYVNSKLVKYNRNKQNSSFKFVMVSCYSIDLTVFKSGEKLKNCTLTKITLKSSELTFVVRNNR